MNILNAPMSQIAVLAGNAASTSISGNGASLPVVAGSSTGVQTLQAGEVEAAVSLGKADSATGPAAVEELGAAVASMQDFVQSIDRNIDFQVDEDSGQMVVKVIASDSGDVIRQIPSEEALELAARLADVRSLLFKEQA